MNKCLDKQEKHMDENKGKINDKQEKKERKEKEKEQEEGEN